MIGWEAEPSREAGIQIIYIYDISCCRKTPLCRRQAYQLHLRMRHQPKDPLGWWVLSYACTSSRSRPVQNATCLKWNTCNAKHDFIQGIKPTIINPFTSHITNDFTKGSLLKSHSRHIFITDSRPPFCISLKRSWISWGTRNVRHNAA